MIGGALILWVSMLAAASPVAGRQPPPSQQACAPASLSEIEEYVKVAAPPAVIRRRIAECGLGFSLDQATEQRLVALGATSEVISVLRAAKPPALTVPPPAPRAGRVAITTSPDGARVTFDGQGVGMTPLTLADVAAGTHNVTISLAGYVDETRRVEVKDRDTARIGGSLKKAPMPKTGAPPPPPTGITSPTLNPTSTGGRARLWTGLALMGGGAAVIGAAAGPLKTADGEVVFNDCLNESGLWGYASSACDFYGGKSSDKRVMGLGVGMIAGAAVSILLRPHPPSTSASASSSAQAGTPHRGRNQMLWPVLGVIGTGVTVAALAQSGSLETTGTFPEPDRTGCDSYNRFYRTSFNCSFFSQTVTQKMPNTSLVGAGLGMAASGAIVLLLGGNHGAAIPAVAPLRKGLFVFKEIQWGPRRIDPSGRATLRTETVARGISRVPGRAFFVDPTGR